MELARQFVVVLVLAVPPYQRLRDIRLALDGLLLVAEAERELMDLPRLG